MKKRIEISDPRTLRGLAHPTRLALVGLLRQHRTLTATEAARLLGLNTGACSFHLRQLAKYGLVEEVSVPGRQKPWRATAQATSFPDVVSGPEMTAALRILSSALAERYAALMMDWVNRRAGESEAWQRAAWFGDMLLHVTPDELYALSEHIERLVAPYEQRVFTPEDRPEGSRLVSVLHVAIPRQSGDRDETPHRED